MSTRIRALDWAQWSPSLTTTIEIMLGSRYAMWLAWGPDLTFFCNDAYQPTLGVKQEWALGTTARRVWAEIWPEIGPRIDHVLRTGQATWDQGLRLVLERSGYPEETFHTFSYSPVPDGLGGIGGMLCVVTEETERVVGERRLSFLHALSSALSEVRTRSELAESLLNCCHQSNLPDLPYLRLELQVECIEWGQPLEQTCSYQVGDYEMVVSLNPLRPFDDQYQNFFSLFVSQVSAALNNVHAYEVERQKAEALAEIDRAKTRFFSNISHEFRTPLTLMLGPLEELLQQGSPELELVHRNALRLLKLVNTLLEFSRLESGRQVASLQSTDLAELTGEVAELFRPMMENAGLVFEVSCSPMGQLVSVDRDMWERVLLNLLSNAFKFTLEGGVRVNLEREGEMAILTVQDTGCGIPQDQLTRVFERFHRVEGTPGRSFEGSGIGLALSLELLQLHGGSLEVCSAQGQGATFIARLPLREPATETPLDAPASAARVGVLNESLTWTKPPRISPASGLRILLADDNEDMRDYLYKILAERYSVETVSDGVEALRAIQRERPALLLTDIMMPGMDGLELLATLRLDPKTASLPVILISARAGEESKLGGFEAGADDYLVKPFAVGELLARVEAQLKRSRMRQSIDLALKAASMVAYEWEPESDRLVISPTAGEVLGARMAGSETTAREFRSIHPDDLPRHLEVLQEAVGREGSFTDQFRWIRPDDGRTIRLEARGTVTRTSYGRVVNGVMVDITEQHETRFALQESQANFEQLLEQAPEPVFLATAEGIYAGANQLACELLLEQKENLLGTPVSSRLRSEDLPRLEVFLNDLTRLGSAAGQWSLRRSDGSYVMVDLTVRILRDGRLLCFARDTTQRQQLLEAERHARSEAERLNRLKDEFLATLSHELRTPLNAISGWAEILASKALGPEDVDQGLEIISRNTRTLTQMIQDLLDMSRVVSGKIQLEMRNFDLAEVVNLAIKSVLPVAQTKGVAVALHLPEGPLPMVGDPQRIQQVVWNLLSNAIRYTPEAGRVEVSLGLQADEVVISVKDTGEGIEADFLPYVFERFRQADGSTTRRYGGLGLGLSIVKQLTELHGGSVAAFSPGKGKGATFELSFPWRELEVCPQQSPTLTEDESTNVNLPKFRSERVLLVEDDCDARQLVIRMLTEHGAQVTAVSSVREALEQLNGASPFQLLVSDIGLPEQDGYDLIAQVRGHRNPEVSTIPAIALTAFVREQDRQRVLESGFQFHLSKPVDARLLLAQCVQLCRQPAEFEL